LENHILFDGVLTYVAPTLHIEQMFGVEHMLVYRHDSDTCGYIQLFHILKTIMGANVSVVSGVLDSVSALEVLTLSNQPCYFEAFWEELNIHQK